MEVPSDSSSLGPPARDESSPNSIPAFVWLASVTMLSLVLVGTLLLPQLIIPDEKHHADMVLMAAEGTWVEDGWPGLGDRLLDPEIVESSLSLGPREAALRENRAAQHPPLYYVATAVTSTVMTWPIDHLELSLQLWFFRLFSVLVSAALPIIFYLIAYEVSSNRWISLAAAVVPLCVPGITLRDGPMVNNDALLILLTALSVLYSIRVAKGDASKANAIRLGLSTGLAVLVKAHALIVLPVAMTAYAVVFIRNRKVSGKWLVSMSLSGGITVMLGAWWWIRNLVLYGTLQPVRDLNPPTEPRLDWMTWLTEATSRIVQSFWGGQFALGGRRYTSLFWVLTILFVVACIVGWVRSHDRATASVSGLYALLMIAAVLGGSALLYAERGTVSGVHGRYLFPAIAGVAPLAVIAVAAITRRASAWLPTLFVTASLSMTLLSIGYMLHRYWAEFGDTWPEQWTGVLALSPVPDPVAIGFLLATVLTFSLLLVSSGRMAFNFLEGRPHDCRDTGDRRS